MALECSFCLMIVILVKKTRHSEYTAMTGAFGCPISICLSKAPRPIDANGMLLVPSSCGTIGLISSASGH